MTDGTGDAPFGTEMDVPLCFGGTSEAVDVWLCSLDPSVKSEDCESSGGLAATEESDLGGGMEGGRDSPWGWAPVT